MARHVLTKCDPVVSPECPGHASVDKFPDCLSTALYGSNFDATTGTVDGFNRWVGLVIQAEAETIDCHENDIPVTIPAGFAAVLTEDDRGFIGWTTYDTAEAAQHDFDRWESAYADYCEDAECREARIVSSTGRTGW